MMNIRACLDPGHAKKVIAHRHLHLTVLETGGIKVKERCSHLVKQVWSAIEQMSRPAYRLQLENA